MNRLPRFFKEMPGDGDGGPTRASDSEELIGESPLFRQALEEAERLAAGREMVLITGETGTGKDLVARRIHLRSSRARGPYEVINCGLSHYRLFEDDLFGHEKGAFIGADTMRHGLIAKAVGGTFVLDFIDCLSLRAQRALFPVLEEKKMRRIGGNTTFSVDVRFVATTNACLEFMVGDRMLRGEFYSRLSAHRVHLPPLRERPEDILPLARYFLARNPHPDGGIAELSPDAENLLCSYLWPGNIRELESAILRAVVHRTCGMIYSTDLTDLDLHIQERERPEIGPLWQL